MFGREYHLFQLGSKVWMQRSCFSLFLRSEEAFAEQNYVLGIKIFPLTWESSNLKWICSNIILARQCFCWSVPSCGAIAGPIFLHYFLDNRHRNPPQLAKVFPKKYKRLIEQIIYVDKWNDVIFIHIVLNIISVFLSGKLHGLNLDNWLGRWKASEGQIQLSLEETIALCPI